MFATLWDEIGGRGFGVLFGAAIGALTTWLLAYWKRVSERRSVMRGDARDTIIISHHLLERATTDAAETPAGSSPPSLRIRSLGQSELCRVVPNGHLATVLLRRAFRVTPRDTLISMDGAEGSYLLETLTNFVCDRVSNAPFDHDLYVMAPCCEPAGLAEHQPISIILIAVDDLMHFENWTTCRETRVERGTEGARVLTLMELARRYQREQAELARLRDAGQRTRFVETMYVLDLALDKRAVPLPAKSVPWGRFEHLLKEMNLE